MIDVSLVKYNGTAYSIKSSIFEKGEKKALLKIIYLYEVRPIAGTTFEKIKTIYDSTVDNEKFNMVKYKGVFDKLIEEISKKYKYDHILV